MALTNTVVLALKPRATAYKVFDERGLFLLVAPNGSKMWRFKYRFMGKEKLIAFGIYPDVSLKLARDKREAARQRLAHKVDPGEEQKHIKAALSGKVLNSFETVAREWISKRAVLWTESTTQKTARRLESDIFPWLGKKSVSDITAPELLAVLRRTEARGSVETAHRSLQNCGQIFRYAIATGLATRDVSADLRGALQPVKGKHLAAIVEPKAIGALLRAIDSYQGDIVTQCALSLAPLVFVRPGELRKAEWKEIDLEEASWNLPAERMKMREKHLVPLSSQAIEIIKRLYPVTGSGRYLFPGARSNERPMSDNAILAALRRMGFAKDEMSGHGFRAMARTVLDEVLHVRPDYIEHQLARAVRDPNGRAYNRTAHLPERRKMMQDWADYLDGLRRST